MDKWEILGRIKAGSRKAKILKVLDQPMTPTEIAKSTGVKLSNTSDALRELVDMGVVSMVTPKEMKKGRLFSLTTKGKQISKLL